MRFYSTEPGDSTTWAPIAFVLGVAVVVLAMGYFFWYAPSQQTHSPTRVTVNAPSTPAAQPSTTVVLPSDPGPTGATGATGATGDQGATGKAGAAGSDGTSGQDGATGATGASGAPGQPGQPGQPAQPAEPKDNNTDGTR